MPIFLKLALLAGIRDRQLILLISSLNTEYLVLCIKQEHGIDFEIVTRTQKCGFWCLLCKAPPPVEIRFKVISTRWVVERTFAWLNRDRRLSREYDLLPIAKAIWI